MIQREGLDCILLIDDDESTNFIHERIITMSGIHAHVQAVTSGRKGLDYLTCQGEFSTQKSFPQPGIIFLDINMPAMNGWEFLEEYNKLPENQKAHVVVAMLTTSVNPDDRIRAEGTKSVSGFKNKPLTNQHLMEIIDQYFPEG